MVADSAASRRDARIIGVAADEAIALRAGLAAERQYRWADG